jgi:hypothetical protein
MEYEKHLILPKLVKKEENERCWKQAEEVEGLKE